MDNIIYIAIQVSVVNQSAEHTLAIRSNTEKIYGEINCSFFWWYLYLFIFDYSSQFVSIFLSWSFSCNHSLTKGLGFLCYLHCPALVSFAQETQRSGCRGDVKASLSLTNVFADLLAASPNQEQSFDRMINRDVEASLVDTHALKHHMPRLAHKQHTVVATVVANHISYGVLLSSNASSKLETCLRDFMDLNEIWRFELLRKGVGGKKVSKIETQELKTKQKNISRH